MNCRRVLQLTHLGEKFDESMCNRMCDNCRNKNDKNTVIVESDKTEECKNMLVLYNELLENKIELT